MNYENFQSNYFEPELSDRDGGDIVIIKHYMPDYNRCVIPEHDKTGR